MGWSEDWKQESGDASWKDDQWQGDTKWKEEADAKASEDWPKKDEWSKDAWGGDAWGQAASAAPAEGAASEAAPAADAPAADAPSAWDTAGAATSAPAWDTAAAEPAKQQWGDSWGGGGASSSTPGPSRDFWDFQKWNKENNVLSRKAEWECERDDNELFVERLGSSAGIAFEKYDAVPVDLSGSKSQLIPVCKSFEELYEKFNACIPTALMDNVRRCRYKTPTPVQKYAIPAGLAGRDIMCCAQTGSGKTAAFMLPVIGCMMKSNDNPIGNLEVPFEGPCMPDTLVITPTRELCIQIYEEALKFCHRTPYIVQRVYGGEKPKVQMELIAKGADVMIACPGRLADFIERGVIKVDNVHILVLDEADRMLDMGFEPQIRGIVENHGMPAKEERQTMMFSATFPEECQKMAQDFLYDYIWIGVGVVGGAVETVEQRCEKVTPAEKYAKLMEILDNFFVTRNSKQDRCLVFVNAKDTAKWLDEQLYEKNIDTGALHGNLDQWEREKNLQRFRKGEIDVMIATDVAARGLDIESVVMVINYDMPQDTDSYIHRIGRTGRIGNQGTAITFISCDEQYGQCLENADTLAKLLKVMQDSKAMIPEWLEGTIAEASNPYQSSKWRWGGQDMREGQETHHGNGAGDEWSNWRGQNSKDDAWGSKW